MSLQEQAPSEELVDYELVPLAGTSKREEVLFWKAHILAEDLAGGLPPELDDVARQYRVVEALASEDHLRAIDLASIVSASPAPGVVLKPKRIADYKLVPITTTLTDKPPHSTTCGAVAKWSNVLGNGHAYELWLDTPTGFMLNYQGWPQAMLGAIAEGNQGLKVTQLQGIRGYKWEGSRLNPVFTAPIPSRGLARLDWQKVMIKSAATIAKQLNLTEIYIQGGANNSWTQQYRSNGLPFMPLADAIKAYDLPAERLGFTKLPNGDWFKSLND